MEYVFQYFVIFPFVLETQRVITDSMDTLYSNLFIIIFYLHYKSLNFPFKVQMNYSLKFVIC